MNVSVLMYTDVIKVLNKVVGGVNNSNNPVAINEAKLETIDFVVNELLDIKVFNLTM